MSQIERNVLTLGQSIQLADFLRGNRELIHRSSAQTVAEAASEELKFRVTAINVCTLAKQLDLKLRFTSKKNSKPMAETVLDTEARVTELEKRASKQAHLIGELVESVNELRQEQSGAQELLRRHDGGIEVQ